MPTLVLDRIGKRDLDKLQKKNSGIQSRWEKTKNQFDINHLHTSLDFKPHKSMKGVYKICLLGRNDGRRIFLKPDTSKYTYYAYAIVNHDELDQ